MHLACDAGALLNRSAFLLIRDRLLAKVEHPDRQRRLLRYSFNERLVRRPQLSAVS